VVTMRIRRVLALGTAYLIFAGAWLSISGAVWSWFRIMSVNWSFLQALLDARAGYLGLLAFGLSASGLLLLTSCQRPEQSERIFSVFRITFYSSAILLLPTLIASVLYMLH
jgi:hypothetical protein